MPPKRKSGGAFARIRGGFKPAASNFSRPLKGRLTRFVLLRPLQWVAGFFVAGGLNPRRRGRISFNAGQALNPPRPITITFGLALLILLLILAPAAQPGISAQFVPTPLPLFALPGVATRVYTSNSIALARDNRTLVAANLVNNSVTILIPAFDKVVAEIPVGKPPPAVALPPDTATGVGPSRDDGTVSVVTLISNPVTATIPVGVLPYGIVMSSADTAY